MKQEHTDLLIKRTGQEPTPSKFSEEPMPQQLSEGQTFSQLSEGPMPQQLPEGLTLQQLPDGLTLTDGVNQLRVDFTHMLKRIRRGNLQQELLVRAAKIKKEEAMPVVLDATAGFAEDSMLLAAAGFYVILYERDSVIEALLRDGLLRASLIPELAPVVSRMKLYGKDSIEAMHRMSDMKERMDLFGEESTDTMRRMSDMKEQMDLFAEESTDTIRRMSDMKEQMNLLLEEEIIPDIIFLDPMFPKRQKSALVKKKFQLLQQLEQPCADETELLRAAMGVHPRKIIIKRPLKGPYLAGVKPDYSISGKSIRYDCLVGKIS